MHRAIAAAEAAAPKMAAMGSYQRKEVLEFCVANFKEKFEDLAMSLCIEAGKPIKVLGMPFAVSSLTFHRSLIKSDKIRVPLSRDLFPPVYACHSLNA